MSDDAPPLEPSSVQLTRMEGVLNLVAFQVTDHGQRLVQVEKDVGTLQMGHQQLASDAQSRDLAVTATAKAMRESKSDEDAAARRAITKSDQMWTPVSRGLTIVVACAAGFGILLNAIQAFNLFG